MGRKSLRPAWSDGAAAGRSAARVLPGANGSGAVDGAPPLRVAGALAGVAALAGQRRAMLARARGKRRAAGGRATVATGGLRVASLPSGDAPTSAPVLAGDARCCRGREGAPRWRGGCLFA